MSASAQIHVHGYCSRCGRLQATAEPFNQAGWCGTIFAGCPVCHFPLRGCSVHESHDPVLPRTLEREPVS